MVPSHAGTDDWGLVALGVRITWKFPRADHGTQLHLQLHFTRLEFPDHEVPHSQRISRHSCSTL